MLYLPPVASGMPQRNTIYNCDALTMLRAMPGESINCIVTSPPYWGLRSYLPNGHINKHVEIGLEPTLKEFIDTLGALFREARRVLRSDGVCFINMGDSYVGGGRGANPPLSAYWKQATNKGSLVGPSPIPQGLKPKDLCGQPWRLAFALQDDGWYLRSDIIWHKPNPMPESVTDRPTKSHEYVFLLTKSERYWYDAEAIREPAQDRPFDPTLKSVRPNDTEWHDNRYAPGASGYGHNPAGRNKCTVWTIPTEPTPFAHFATFPQALIEPMILAGCPKEVCAVCGAPYVREVEATGGTIGQSWHDHTDDLGYGQRIKDKRGKGISGGASNAKDEDGNGYQRVDKGFKPSCDCHASTRPGIVYDPFMGSGTSAIVAQRLGRDFCGSELNHEYLQIANGRLAHPDPKEFKREIAGLPTTQPMFMGDKLYRPAGAKP